MSLFYRFVVKGMDVENFNSPAIGMMTPYSAIFVFSIGVLLSNFVFNTLVMKYPFVGEKVSYSEYFKGNTKTHICGMLGGAIWGLGSAFSYIASGEAGPADRAHHLLPLFGEYLSGKNLKAQRNLLINY